MYGPYGSFPPYASLHICRLAILKMETFTLSYVVAPDEDTEEIDANDEDGLEFIDEEITAVSAQTETSFAGMLS